MVDEVPESAVRAAHEVRAVVGRLRRRLREVAGTDELTPSQTSVLSRLSKAGDASASELAGAERVRPQSMAATLGVLAERGMIARRPDPDDGRRQVVSLTQAGRAWVSGSRQVRQEWLARALADRCTERQRQVVIEAMALLDGLDGG